ncbi:hypothetical protein PsorP6_004114 [Peronosclerospora sorghi]|uniref:Uncharacterized protein n=1 Tax=Peronosclerospora sorghi TaxID=230839 RepID=A0ACC0VJ80_9STRA|nr:hypothetical protein PsorP6_004114 [Peronosclerospora sorghi]
MLAETDVGSKNETTPNTVVEVVLSGVFDEIDLDTEIISEQSSVSSDVNAIKALIDEDTRLKARAMMMTNWSLWPSLRNFFKTLGQKEFSGRRGRNSHGAGEGKKDVRDEFEDEEQLLGLQGDIQEEPEPPSEQKSEDSGLEMQDDFEGTMHDMTDDEEGEQNESKDREDLDREMGDFDQNDENVVDAKLWGEDSDAMRIELTRKS